MISKVNQHTQLVTRAQMRRYDQRAASEFAIPSILLMENAGRGVAELVASKIDSQIHVLIFIGKGSNGGDGFVAARHLSNKGYKVSLFLLSDPSEFNADTRLNYDIITELHLPIILVSGDAGFLVADQYLKGPSCVVDAIFGMGLNAPVTGIHEKLIRRINSSAKTVFAVDIPSGLDADSGEILGVAVQAQVTAALGMKKIGLTLNEGPKLSGEIHVLDISLPRAFYE